MFKKTWVRWAAVAAALSVPAIAFAATQAADCGGCILGMLGCPF